MILEWFILHAVKVCQIEYAELPAVVTPVKFFCTANPSVMFLRDSNDVPDSVWLNKHCMFSYLKGLETKNPNKQYSYIICHSITNHFNHYVVH